MSFFRRRVIEPIVQLLTQGVTPEKIALSVSMGIACGVFPVLGSTTILCTIVAIVFRLNLPAIQAVNYIAYPLQLLMIVPFVRMGEFLFHARPLQLSLKQMLQMAHADLPLAISTLWVAALQAASAWMLLCPIVVGVLYFPLLQTFRRLVRKRLSDRESLEPESSSHD